jgi:hypothetical protein
MRLIDADALVVCFENLTGDTIAVTDAAAVADNAPTVCCEQCEHWRPQDATGDPNDSCCGNEVLDGHMEHGYNPPARFGCSNYYAAANAAYSAAACYAAAKARRAERVRAEKAEAEARRWEWVAKQASRDRRTPDGPLLDTLLAHYEEAHG